MAESKQDIICEQRIMNNVVLAVSGLDKNIVWKSYRELLNRVCMKLRNYKTKRQLYRANATLSEVLYFAIHFCFKQY